MLDGCPKVVSQGRRLIWGAGSNMSCAWQSFLNMVPTTWELKFLSVGIPSWSLKKPCERWSNVYFLSLDIRIARLDPHFPSWFPSLISQISSKLRPTHGDQVGPLLFRSLMAKSVPACPKLQKKPTVSRALTRKRRANTHNGTSKTRNPQQQNTARKTNMTGFSTQPFEDVSPFIKMVNVPLSC